ncbi:hypothetical protein B0H67DRAFT_553419 [Lasiosphaeris hirsuta]|uniref:Uncharacterized protein n=1 Tax=Lasiosphaeris hirsuta TaxID=260670 RepID=A0AA40AFA0_9PEZI|nr:hypothetical protein B0H67DRAFT_553419 [Lasiosphaeris hirsuta]
MLADCEGLEGGEREPSGVKFKSKWRREEERKARLDEGYFKAQRIASQYKLEWSVGEDSKTRGFAVTHLYPRLLYAFSDVIVFVLHNARQQHQQSVDRPIAYLTIDRVIEQVFEKLLTWAVNAIETSSNQPILPHAIIVLNKHEDYPNLSGSSTNTKDILRDMSPVIEVNKTFLKCAEYWRERGKPIHNLEELIRCYCSSIEILRVPRRDRPQLVHDRVKQLQVLVSNSCSAAQTTRSRTGMLLDMHDFQAYMQEAFTVFSMKLDSPFDFTVVSLRRSQLLADFSGNLLKLLRGVVDIWKHNLEVPMQEILLEITCLATSSIMLDTARHRDKGSPTDIFPRYVKTGKFSQLVTVKPASRSETIVKCFCTESTPTCRV